MSNEISDKEIFLDAFDKDAHISINKNLIKTVGILEAILFSDLVSKYKYFKKRNMLQDGWFFNTASNISEDTGLSQFQQSRLIKKLAEINLIQVKIQGLPAKQHFKINIQETIKQVSKKLENLNPKNLETINMNNNNMNNSNNRIINNSISDFEKSQANPLDDQKENPLAKQSNHFNLLSIRIISSWNNIPHVSVHKIIKPYSKTILQIIQYLNSLQKGTFAKGRHFDPDWIKKEKIPEPWFTRAWTYQELKDGLLKASNYSLEGYWPPNNKQKSNYKSLTYILYNGKDRSWLFSAMQNPPQPLKNTQFKNSFPETTSKLMKHSIWPPDYKFDEVKLAQGLIELNNFSKNLIKDPYNKSKKYFGDLQKLLEEYLQWLSEQDWIDDIGQNIIGINNGMFRRFIEDQEKEIGIEIRSKG